MFMYRDQGQKARVIQTTIFVCGMNTLVQTFFGTRLPVVSGVSFAYLIPTLTIINSSNLQTIADNHEVNILPRSKIQNVKVPDSTTLLAKRHCNEKRKILMGGVTDVAYL